MGGSTVESALRAWAAGPDLRLIETLAWDGENLLNLDLHLTRLLSSAARLGWPCDPLAVVEALRASARSATPARLRLTLGASGSLVVEPSSMPPAKPVWQVGLAHQRLSSADIWLSLKSNKRHAYDAARATLPKDLDELILQNERGEVCDGTITTVFFDRGDGLRTPPLTSGVLPGVLRAKLNPPEEVLLVKHLADVQIWVGNSLRGLMRAEFRG